MAESFQVYGIKFVRDKFSDSDRYLSKNGGVTTDLGDAWFNSDIDHANWYAKYKSQRNSRIETSPFSFEMTEDGNPIPE